MAENEDQVPALSPRQLRLQQEAKIADLKSRSVIPALEALAEELEQRAESGQLAEELRGMKAGSIINNLTKILASIKTAAVVVMPQAPVQMRDTTALRAQSAVQLSEGQRAARRKQAEAVDAELMEPDAE